MAKVKTYKHGEERPASQFEEAKPCVGEHDCPFEEWIPRLRWLLHCNENSEAGREERNRNVNLIGKTFTEVLTDMKIDDPMAVAMACFEIQELAWKRMKQFVEHDRYRPVIQ